MSEPEPDTRLRFLQSAVREAERMAQEFEWLDESKWADYWHAEAARLRRLIKEGNTYEPRF